MAASPIRELCLGRRELGGQGRVLGSKVPSQLLPDGAGFQEGSLRVVWEA